MVKRFGLGFLGFGGRGFKVDRGIRGFSGVLRTPVSWS